MLTGLNDSNTLRVLVVEDDEEDFTLVKRYLGKVDTRYSLDWVPTYELGCSAWESNDYDVCLTDYSLGKKNGLDLIKLVNRHEYHSPVILLTGLNQSAIDVLSIEEGAEDFLFKSEMSGPLLDRTIRQSIERLKARQALRQSEDRFRILSEVSTEALHNIGNVLNSLVTSCSLIKQTMESSRVMGLERVRDMLRKKPDNAHFMKEGTLKKLTAYLMQLAEVAREEQDANLTELLSLEKGLGLVGRVIRDQKSLFKTGGKVETFPLMEAVKEALHVRANPLQAQDVRIISSDIGLRICTERMTVTHILINLIKNAGESMFDNGSRPRELTLKTTLLDNGTASLLVSDTGCGIAKEDLPFLFQHGFTTKSSGSGVGLHFCKCALEALGAEILVESEGLGEGSTFHLVFPTTLVAS